MHLNLYSTYLQPVTIEGAPLDHTGKPESSNETLEPVPLSESHKRQVGGISVAESRDLMREADLIDRKVERERIRSKHKEQRKKIKKRRREEQVRRRRDPLVIVVGWNLIIVGFSDNTTVAIMINVKINDAFSPSPEVSCKEPKWQSKRAVSVKQNKYFLFSEEINAKTTCFVNRLLWFDRHAKLILIS